MGGGSFKNNNYHLGSQSKKGFSGRIVWKGGIRADEDPIRALRDLTGDASISENAHRQLVRGYDAGKISAYYQPSENRGAMNGG